MIDPENRAPILLEETSTPAIRTLDLAKRYGKITALRGLTMSVPRGEIFGFLGPNGAGKTTAVKLLLGLARPSGGEGWVLSAPLGDLEARRRVGYLPELFRYQEWLTAREVLALHCSLARLPRRRWADEIAGALRLVGLDRRGDSRVSTFSKGMQQRLGLGVALLGSPDLVVLDEPTSALDPVGRVEVRDIIHELKRRGATVFLNSHLLSEVEQVVDRVAVIDHGHVLALSGIADFTADTQTVRVRLTGVTASGSMPVGRFSLTPQADGWWMARGIMRDQAPDLVAALVGLGARVYAVEPGHHTLEERFLQLLKGGEHASGADYRPTDHI
ncbi:MAG TPA: ABC transporter ATP-binding protein [Chloroflexota bacterium]|nr:ABC transporter ATP-binding protein [Chloroflexota bacterium]